MIGASGRSGKCLPSARFGVHPAKSRGEGTMATSVQEPTPIIPALGSFYEKSRDLSWLVVRLTAGGMLLVHGSIKLTTSSIAAFATNSRWMGFVSRQTFVTRSQLQ